MKEPEKEALCRRDPGAPGNAEEKVKGNSMNFNRVNNC